MSEKPTQESLERAMELVHNWDGRPTFAFGVDDWRQPFIVDIAITLDQARDAALKSSPGAMIEAFCEWNARKEPLATYEDAYYAGWQDRALKGAKDAK